MFVCANTYEAGKAPFIAAKLHAVRNKPSRLGMAEALHPCHPP